MSFYQSTCILIV